MIQAELLKQLKPGARVKVWEGAATAPFEGLVLARKHGSESGATFTVRTTLAGVGVEKVYPINTPVISKLEVISSPKKVHKSKLYFVRDMPQRKIRKKLGVAV
ncbi:50S ribosomal protein L19 [uncultured archaeon]|nr:50S ribosomal protein L19 [uncultured archaeon]